MTHRSSVVWVLALLLLPGAVARAQTGSVAGSVELVSRANPELVVRRFRRLVVYLEPIDAVRWEVPAAAEIRQKDAVFRPSFLVVCAGQRVAFVNDDDIFHNVYSPSGAKPFDLGLYKSRTTKKVTFDKPGVVKVHCSIHETMNALIYVAPSPFYAVLEGGGAFAIEGVPPGRYKLRTWHRRFPAGGAEVVVGEGKRAEVQVRLGEIE